MDTGSLRRWLDSPVVHISTASFIATGMLVALSVKVFLHDLNTTDIVLLVAIAGASVPLLISLVQQVFGGKFSVDLLAFLSIITSLILEQYWVASMVVLRNL
jgi:cation transport ATPase